MPSNLQSCTNLYFQCPPYVIFPVGLNSWLSGGHTPALCCGEGGAHVSFRCVHQGFPPLCFHAAFLSWLSISVLSCLGP